VASSRRLPVWVHQAVAYLAGAVIVGFAVHAPSADGPLLLAGAGLVVALALLTKGPLGPFRLLGRRALRPAEVVAAAALVVLPFVQPGGPRLEVVVTLWLAAAALLRLAVFPLAAAGEVAAPRPRDGAARPSGRPSDGPRDGPAAETRAPDAETRPPDAETRAPDAASALDAAVRQAGRRTGQAGRRVRQVGQLAQPAMLRGARALGRVAGRRQAGRRGDDTASS
jgi:hypothetical protein